VLVCPVEVLAFKQTFLLIVHPSAKKEALDFATEHFCQCTLSNVNQFKIYSKSIGLKHLYNVLEPLAADEDSKLIFKNLIDIDFDSQVIKDN